MSNQDQDPQNGANLHEPASRLKEGRVRSSLTYLHCTGKRGTHALVRCRQESSNVGVIGDWIRGVDVPGAKEDVIGGFR